MCFEKIKPSFNEVNRYALEMIKRHELSLETLNKVGHNFAEWVMTPEEEAKGFSPIAGQGFMNKAAQLGANLAGGNGGNSGNGPNVPPGGFQSPPPSGFQGPPPGFQGPPSGGYGGGFGGNGGWGQGGQGGGYNPQPYNSNNQFNPDNYLPIYQPNNFGPNGNVPMNPNFQGMHLPKTALKYAPDYPEQSKVVDDDLDRTLEERLKRI